MSRSEIVGQGEDSLECLRPFAHHGPHLIRQADGTFVAWEDDLCEPGVCEYCDREDPVDWCIAYDTVSAIDAHRLISDGSLES